MFDERWIQSGIIINLKPAAFSIMLYGRALRFYSDCLQTRTLDFEAACQSIRSLFITAKYARTLFREWDPKTLRSFWLRIPPALHKNVRRSLLQDLRMFSPHCQLNTEVMKFSETNKWIQLRTWKLVGLLISNPQKYFKVLSRIFTHPLLHQDRGQHLKTYFLLATDFKVGKSSTNENIKTRLASFAKKGCWSTNHSTLERIKALRERNSALQFMTLVIDDEQHQSDVEESIEEIEELAAHFVENKTQLCLFSRVQRLKKIPIRGLSQPLCATMQRCMH